MVSNRWLSLSRSDCILLHWLWLLLRLDYSIMHNRHFPDRLSGLPSGWQHNGKLLQSLILAMYYLFRYQPTTKKHPIQVFPVTDAVLFSLQKKDLPVLILFQKACLCTGFPVPKGVLLHFLVLLEVLLQTSVLDGSNSNIF